MNILAMFISWLTEVKQKEETLTLKIPRGRKEVYETYGNPGFKEASTQFKQENLRVEHKLPGDWNDGRNRLYCHRLMAPYLREALNRCTPDELAYITRIGCYNFRHQRHDSLRPLSYHAWGIAVDINPSQNGPKRYKRGTAPKPFSVEWHAVWPNAVPEGLVTAFKSVGFSWGGDWKSFPDPMHFELKR